MNICDPDVFDVDVGGQMVAMIEEDPRIIRFARLANL
jgi:hypothetical protein